MNPFFRKWGELVVGYRWIFLAVVLAITGAAIYSIVKNAYIDNSVEAFGNSSSNAQEVLEEFRDEFGRDDVFMVIVEGDVFTPEYIDRLDKLHKALAKINVDAPSLGERKADRDAKRGWYKLGRPFETAFDELKARSGGHSADFDEMDDAFGADEQGWKDVEGGSIIDETNSLINARVTAGSESKNDWGQMETKLDIHDLMRELPTTPEQMVALRKQVLGDPEAGIPPNSTLVGRVIDDKGMLSTVLLRTQFMDEKDSKVVNDEIQTILDQHSVDGFKLHLSGMPALAASLNRLMLGDMQKLFGVALLVLALVLLLIFRNPIGAIAPMCVVALSAIWAFGGMFAIGWPMTMITNVLPAFLICVGVADSVHVISVYRDARAVGIENNEAVIQAVAATGVPVFFTSLTTALGLLSFMLASVDAIGQMGRVGAFGVGLAFVHTLIFLPIALTFNKRGLMGVKAKSAAVIDRFLAWCAGLSTGDKRRRLTLVVSFTLTAAAIYGASTLRVWHNPLSWVPEDRAVRIAADLADSKLGGAASIQLMVRSNTEKGVKDVAFLKGMAKLEKSIHAYVDPGTKEQIVGNTFSVLDVVRESYRALNGGKQEFYRVPDTQEKVDAVFFAFESSDPGDLKRLMTINARTAHLTVQLKWLEATAYKPLAAYVEKAVDEHIPKDKASVDATGSAFTLLSTVGALLMDMIKSFGFAFLFITLVMIFLLKDLKLGLIAMVPNLMPIVYILGLMGFANIPIDMANLMIASIALGIAVDDTIHFLHHFRVNYDQSGNVEEAIAHSMAHCGRALVITSIILSLGFFVYLAATMYSMQRFGALIGLTVIFAVLLDLIVTPALLRTFFKNKKPIKGQADERVSNPVSAAA